METFLLFELVSWSIYKTMAFSNFCTKLCNNGLCTSLDVEAGYCLIHYLKKSNEAFVQKKHLCSLWSREDGASVVVHALALRADGGYCGGPLCAGHPQQCVARVQCAVSGGNGGGGTGIPRAAGGGVAAQPRLLGPRAAGWGGGKVEVVEGQWKAPAEVRFPAKASSARRSSGWHSAGSGSGSAAARDCGTSAGGRTRRRRRKRRGTRLGAMDSGSAAAGAPLGRRCRGARAGRHAEQLLWRWVSQLAVRRGGEGERWCGSHV